MEQQPRLNRINETDRQLILSEGKWFYVSRFGVHRFRDHRRAVSVMFLAGHIVVTIVSLVWLFWEFLASSQMLYSNDIIAFGVFYRTILKEYLIGFWGVLQWNPYICCGIPFIDAIHGGIFYPLTSLDFCGSIFRAIGYNFMLHYLLCSLFMYLAARQLKLPRIAASFAGFAYALSPCLISWVAPGHEGKLYVAALFPLLFLVFDKLLESRRLLHVGLAGLVYGIVILTPHFQMVYYASGLVLLYAVYRLLWFRTHGGSWRTVGVAGSMVVIAMSLGLCVSAIQLLPSASYLPIHSPRATVQKGFDSAAQYSLREEEVISQVIPEFSGCDPKKGGRLYWGKNRFKDNSEVAGTVVLLVALLAFLTRGRPEKFFWGGVAVVVILYAVGPMTPVFGILLTVIPFLDSMAGPPVGMFIFAFSLALLGGFAIENLRNRALSLSEPQRRFLLRGIWTVPVLLLLFGIVVTLRGPEFMLHYCQIFHPLILPSATQTPAKWGIAMANLPHLQSGVWIAFACSVIVAIIVRLSLRGRARNLLLAVLPLLVVVSDCMHDQRYFHTFDYTGRFGVQPVIELLKTHVRGERVVVFGRGEGAIQLGYYGLASTVGYHGKEPIWYYDLIGGYQRANMLNERVANLLNTRFVVCPLNRSLPVDTLGPVFLDTLGTTDDYVVLENKNCFPRAYFVDRYVVTKDRQTACSLVVSGGADLRRTVYLEEEPDGHIDDAPNGPATATIEDYNSDHITISVDNRTDRLLVISDTWYPAWHATIDGIPTKVYRADGALRAVVVTAGSREVVLTYSSGIYKLGRGITWFGLLAIGFIVIGQLWSTGRRRP